MAVSPAETLMPWQSIILEYEAHYRASKKTERAKVVKEVYKAVQSDCQAKNIPIGLTLHAFSDKLRNYYGNHKAADPEHLESLSSLGLGRDWNVRRVVWNLKKAEIGSIIETEIGHQPGTGAYLGCYQKVTTQVVQNLPEEERAEYQRIADEWNNNGPLLDIKKEMATKFAGQYVQSFLNIMKMQFGVEMMVFGGYLDNKDAINTFREQTTPTLPVESFMKIQKKPIADLFESWKDFCQDKITEHIQDEDDNDEQGSSSLVPAKTQDKGMPRILPVDDAGHCVLPELDSRFKAAVPGFVRQEMLRSWLTYWYRQAVGRPKASIPWAELSSDPEKFIDPTSSPDIVGFRWMDPSKIRVSFIDELWEFYYERIQSKDEPIVFLTGRNANKDSDTGSRGIRQKKTGRKSRKDKGKGKAPEVEVEKRKKRAVPDDDGTSNDRGKKVGSSSRAPRDEEIDEEDFTKAVDACGTDSEVDDGPLNHHGKKGDEIGSSASQNESPVIDNLSPAAWSMPERRETFLPNLVGDKEYVSLVKCLPKAPRNGLRPKCNGPYPQWATWKYTEKYMPARFHHIKYHRRMVKQFFENGGLWMSGEGQLADIKYLYQACLGIGLALRDIHTVQFQDPDGPSDLPEFMSNSDLTILHAGPILEVCTKIVQMIEHGSAPTSGSGQNIMLDTGHTPESGDPTTDRPSVASGSKRKEVPDKADDSQPPLKQQRRSPRKRTIPTVNKSHQTRSKDNRKRL